MKFNRQIFRSIVHWNIKKTSILKILYLVCLLTIPQIQIKETLAKPDNPIQDLDGIVEATNKALSSIEEQVEKEIKENNFSTNTQPKIENNFSYRQELLTIEDRERNRIFPVDLYLPESNNKSLPLIVISHGLGGDRKTFDYLARYLVSQGFAVAIPEHTESKGNQGVQKFLEELGTSLNSPQQFIDRPQDITSLLDKLENLYEDKINTQEVGIIGQSFGGYTALSLIGAELNFNNLKKVCHNAEDSFNISLVLQCSALKLPHKKYNLQDKRIKSAIAINPFTSAVFGKKGMSKINRSITIISGSSDTITPALSEQIEPFTWIKQKDKYLAIFRGGTHFSTVTNTLIPSLLSNSNYKIGQDYLKQLSYTFFYNSIFPEPKETICFCASYGQKIGDRIMPLDLVQSLKL